MVQRNTILSQEEFITSCRNVWGDRYDLSKVVYRGLKNKVEVVCPKHGSFLIDAGSLKKGCGCVLCGRERAAKKRNSNTETFVEKVKSKYGDDFDYSEVDYVNSRTKVKIICKKHGAFYVTPSNLLHGYGCRLCGYERNANAARLTTEEFILRAKAAHGNKYDYSKVNYIRNSTPIKIVCPIHGEFEQEPWVHISGHGCPKCGEINMHKLRLSTEDFVRMATETHGDTYDYSYSEYSGIRNKVKILCKKHGLFLQSAKEHIRGHGCPKCTESHGEEAIRIYLEGKEIEYEQEKSFDGCKCKYALKFDFFLPKQNTCIEYQGEQHYRPIHFFDKGDGYLGLLHRDQIKRDYCKRNGIQLIEVRYNENVAEALNMFNK